MLAYDAAVFYDTPLYTYDGVSAIALTIKEALYRELAFGPVLQGLVAAAHVKLDMRNAPSALRTDSDYPYVICRRITETEDNQVNLARSRCEIEVVGIRSSAGTGDDALEAIHGAIVAYFGGAVRSIGGYDLDGTPDPDIALRVKGRYVTTVEGESPELGEKAHILVILFTYLRP